MAPIRRLLFTKGWTQGELAEKAKIRPTTLSEALNGRSPRMDTLEKAAAALDVPLWALFVDERQYELLTKQRMADENVTREAEITDRVERKVMERIAGIVREETAAELTGPKPVEVVPPVQKRKRA